MNERWLREAFHLARRAVEKNRGGPFGAIIVRDNEIVSRGWNRVTSSHDPTAHAEMVAIRSACRKLRSFQLDDCELYASCEPCPMCLAAIYWARIPRVVFGAGRRDAARVGFDDDLIYKELSLPLKRRRIKFTQILSKDAQRPLDLWACKPDKVRY
jgi:tRNA(Arg) A34 adenosine deaminase TadA